MKKMICLLMAIPLALVSLYCVAAVDFSTVTKYAAACEDELGFNAADVPSFNCNDGLVFNSANDTVGHANVSGYVDMVFACRHLSEDGFSAVSVELLIHNRASGSTCFFAAKDARLHPAPGTDPVIFADIGSPFASNADDYWTTPFNLSLVTTTSGSGSNTNFTRTTSPLLCVGCHVAGPYIASPAIAPVLAQFGLLNDGHDTVAARYHSIGSFPADATNTGMPSAQNPFPDWDRIVKRNNVADICAAGCHSIGSKSTTPAVLDAEGSTLIPSIRNDIEDIRTAGVMPANNYPDSDYRWVNMDIPDSPGDYQESETLADLKIHYPLFYCSNPVSLSARRVDSGIVISTNDFPDKFNRFNLQDGLVCLNADQPSGRCQNYQTRYHCNGRWTAWQDNDDPSYSGDWELRRDFKGLCASPDGIQAGYKVGNKLIFEQGPIDRLAEFDNKGLVCINADQNNGQCSNYVVRFYCQIKQFTGPIYPLPTGTHPYP
jgi:hypothetical protein